MLVLKNNCYSNCHTHFHSQWMKYMAKNVDTKPVTFQNATNQIPNTEEKKASKSKYQPFLEPIPAKHYFHNYARPAMFDFDPSHASPNFFFLFRIHKLRRTFYKFIQKSFDLIIGWMGSIHNLEIEVSFHLRTLFLFMRLTKSTHRKNRRRCAKKGGWIPHATTKYTIIDHWIIITAICCFIGILQMPSRWRVFVRVSLPKCAQTQNNK